MGTAGRGRGGGYIGIGAGWGGAHALEVAVVKEGEKLPEGSIFHSHRWVAPPFLFIQI